MYEILSLGCTMHPLEAWGGGCLGVKQTNTHFCSICVPLAFPEMEFLSEQTRRYVPLLPQPIQCIFRGAIKPFRKSAPTDGKPHGLGGKSDQMLRAMYIRWSVESGSFEGKKKFGEPPPDLSRLFSKCSLNNLDVFLRSFNEF